jgi:hypothetical protein
VVIITIAQLVEASASCSWNPEFNPRTFLITLDSLYFADFLLSTA